MFKSLLPKQDNSIFSSFLLQKKGIILFSILLFPYLVHAQRDVIVTQANEEIRCRILDETPTRFIYAYIGPKGRILRNEIFKNLVKDFKYNKFDNDLVQHSAKEKKEDAEFRARNSEPSVKDKTGAGKDVGQEKVTPGRSEVRDGKSETPIAEVKPSQKRTSAKKSDEVINPSDSQGQSQRAPEKTDLKKTSTANTESANQKIPGSDQKEGGKSEPGTKVNSKNSTAPSDESEQNKPQMEVAKKVDADKVGKSAQALSGTGSTNEVSVQRPTAVPEDVEVLLPKSTTDTKTQLPEKPGATQTERPAAESDEKSAMPAPLKWRVGIKGGIGNIRDNGFNASDAFGLYQEKLMKGFTLGGDIAFFPMKNVGLGAIFTDFRSKNQADNLNFINPSTGSEVTGSITNSVSRKFIGPALLFRKSIDFKTYLVFTASPGMYFYSDKGDYNGEFFDYRGKQFGGATTLGIDFLLGNDIIGRDIILSLEAGYNYGRLSQIDYNNGVGPVTLASPLVIDRLDFSIGLRFMRFPKYLKNSAY